ncbi:MAG: pilin, partial [bacterium]
HEATPRISLWPTLPTVDCARIRNGTNVNPNIERCFKDNSCRQAKVLNATASIVSQGTGQVPSGSVTSNWNYDTTPPNIRPDAFLIQRFKKQGTMEQYVAYIPSSSQTGYSYTDIFSQSSDVANSSDLFYLIWPIIESNERLGICQYFPGTYTSYTPPAQTNTQPVFQPQGAFETVNNATCSIAGWARDQDDPTKSVDFHVYVNGPYDGGGTFVVGQVANSQRTQAPAGNYQFNINFTQGAIRDGRQHSLYVYAINLPNTPGWSQLIGTKDINCQASGAFAAAIAGTKKTCESCTAGGECASGNCASGKCASVPCAAGSICVPNPICSETFEELLDRIAGFIFWVAIILVPIMIIIGAFIILTAAGDPEKIKKAMNIFLYTAIGVILVLTARALASVINNIFKS